MSVYPRIIPPGGVGLHVEIPADGPGNAEEEDDTKQGHSDKAQAMPEKLRL